VRGVAECSTCTVTQDESLLTTSAACMKWRVRESYVAGEVIVEVVGDKGVRGVV
jgi:hypothetical protein